MKRWETPELIDFNIRFTAIREKCNNNGVDDNQGNSFCEDKSGNKDEECTTIPVPDYKSGYQL